jgi:8-oxo-dGTP diphosphatase
MKLLASLTAKDVEDDAPEFDYANFAPRSAVRAVVRDGDKICLIHVSEHNYYMLPGGGIDDGEDMQTALAREIMEEIGCTATVVGEVGSIEVYNDRWRKKQTDFCYVMNKDETAGGTAITDFEASEGHKVIWALSLNEAIRLVKDAAPINRDGKLVRARDLLFLQAIL